MKTRFMHVLHMLVHFDARPVERFTYNIICTPALNRTFPIVHGLHRVQRSPFYIFFKAISNFYKYPRALLLIRTHISWLRVVQFIPDPPNVFFTIKLYILSLFFIQFLTLKIICIFHHLPFFFLFLQYMIYKQKFF